MLYLYLSFLCILTPDRPATVQFEMSRMTITTFSLFILSLTRATRPLKLKVSVRSHVPRAGHFRYFLNFFNNKNDILDFLSS